MKAIIVEDESAAVSNLQAIINDVSTDIDIIAILDSIEATVNYLKKKKMPDLIFMDIHLADGESFAVFKQIEISCPVIFTTAYDSYALEAFKVNSIDYLLKPIEPEHVVRALDKLQRLSQTDRDKYTKHVNDTFIQHKDYKKTILVSFRDKLIPVPVSQIAYFYTKDENTTLIALNGDEWLLDRSLETIMSDLDPSEFIRANRQYIIAHKAVKEIVVWFGNRLAINLVLPTKERIIISKAKVSLFKKWLVKN